MYGIETRYFISVSYIVGSSRFPILTANFPEEEL